MLFVRDMANRGLTARCIGIVGNYVRRRIHSLYACDRQDVCMNKVPVSSSKWPPQVPITSQVSEEGRKGKLRNPNIF